MAQVKGTALIHRFKMMAEVATAEQTAEITARFLPELKAAYVRHGIIAARWYPLEWMTSIMLAMDAVIGKGDLLYCIEIGREVGMLSGRGIYKMFFKFGSPEFIFKNAAILWKQLFDTGICKTEVRRKAEGRMTISGFSDMPKCLYYSLLGWCMAVVTLSGGANPNVKIAQWPNGQDPLIISGSWEKSGE